MHAHKFRRRRSSRRSALPCGCVILPDRAMWQWHPLALSQQPSQQSAPRPQQCALQVVVLVAVPGQMRESGRGVSDHGLAERVERTEKGGEDVSHLAPSVGARAAQQPMYATWTTGDWTTNASHSMMQCMLSETNFLKVQMCVHTTHYAHVRTMQAKKETSGRMLSRPTICCCDLRQTCNLGKVTLGYLIELHI